METLEGVYRQGRKTLSRAGIEGPGFEADCLFQKAFGLSRQERILRAREEAGPEAADRFRDLIRERRGGRPLQYLLGEWPFCGRSLLVGEGVLIPREETELLVETASAMLESTAAPAVLDLCSGTGAVALALADRFPESDVRAVEWMEPALGYLNRNIARSGLPNVRAVRLDVLDPESARPFRELDCIVSNPPYVRTDELPGLQREVLREPREALDGGADGLGFYRAIAAHWVPSLRNGGALCAEVGEGQAEEVARIFAGAGMERLRFFRDFNRIERVVSGLKPE
ncbi:peptide chain release factor N(5)-glutamine methyltransferase [Caproiciproducens sp. NJN-50]|uniref:peptide chain release factor N(5)-glutamine methyltransferase n=1 Tax=Acutalibacteraceae TaxID=3082771 RepID=UPI000FFE15C8|nr:MULTISPECIES: peptide chain release factor N(5)-glutamine methyltransferase [Acutalibacteraceae]QAT50881.1 peptide chain release factor N(5)-glutamine methyltransferase [Caproiciproducens sp. NJN-50]